MAIYLHINPGEDIYGYNLIVSTTDLHGAQYGKDFIEDYKRRLGVSGSPGDVITVLRSVVMDPWVTETYPLIGKHYVRAPILAHQQELKMPSVVACYQQALAKGDLETIVQQFEPNGLAREPSGSKYFYQGTEQLRYFYAMLFSNNGGIPLEHCTITNDNTCCAIEYNVTNWGQTQLAPQAGVAVYCIGASGLLVAARIYDDVEPP